MKFEASSTEGTKGRAVRLVFRILFPILPALVLLGDLLARPDLAYLFRDLGSLTFPAKFLIADSLRSFGELPAWNPFVVGGTPLLADPSFASHNPFNLVFLLFSKEHATWAFSWFLALHLPLIFFGFERLFSLLGHTRPMAVLLAGIAGSGGFVASAVNTSGALASMAGAGWLGLFWLKFLRGGSSLHLFGASLALVFPLLSGDPQFSLLYAFFLLPALASGERAPVRRVLGGYATLGVLAFLAAAPQILPTADLVLRSDRSSEGWFNSQGEVSSLHPLRWLEFFTPLPFGSGIFDESKRSIVGHTGVPITYVLSLYQGAMFLPLLAAAWWGRFRVPGKIWLALAGLFGLVSMGAFSPVPANKMLAAVLPLWSSFRYPERITYFVFVALLFLLSALIRSSSTADLFARLRIFLALAMAGLVAWGIFGFAEGRHFAFGAAAALGLALGVLEALRRRWISQELALYFLAALAILEPAFTLRQIIWKVPAEVAQSAWPPFVRQLKEKGARFGLNDPTRYSTYGDELFDMGLLKKLVGGNHSGAELLTYHQYYTLSNNTGAVFGLANALGFVTLLQGSPIKFWEFLMRHRPNAAFPIKGTNFLGAISPRGDFVLTEVRGAIPLVRIPSRISFLPAGSGYERLADSSWNWQETALVDAGEGDNETVQPEGAGAALHSRTYNAVVLDVQAEKSKAPFWVHFNESFDPFWSATYEGESLELRQVNFWSTGILVPAGAKGKIHLNYDNPLIPAGRSLFAIWILLLAAEVVRSRKRRSRG